MATVAIDACSASAALAAKLLQDTQGAQEEERLSSAAAELENDGECSEAESSSCSRCDGSESQESAAPSQLQAGIYHDPPATPVTTTMSRQQPAQLPDEGSETVSQPGGAPAAVAQAPPPQQQLSKETRFQMEETFFVFDWDDTVLPSTWVKSQGLRLDAGSLPSAEQRAALAEVAATAGRLLRAARQHGTVILVTNAERGWIELSCQKFLPTLAPMLENVKMVSARTSYEGPHCPSPLEWKLRAFEDEIASYFGFDALMDPSKRKNILSLGDSVHEREALLTATSSLCNGHSKSLKFVERPDLSQICKQHELITNSFDNIVHHNGNLDFCIRCP